MDLKGLWYRAKNWWTATSRWLRGRCPKCGGQIKDWSDDKSFCVDCGETYH